ncbi:MAG: hypothetical protein M1338_02480 [Patescibacteria group bacterium]|nr:hypothetical protein [Patescibacteria group bacterium]
MALKLNKMIDGGKKYVTGQISVSPKGTSSFGGAASGTLPIDTLNKISQIDGVDKVAAMASLLVSEPDPDNAGVSFGNPPTIYGADNQSDFKNRNWETMDMREGRMLDKNSKDDESQDRFFYLIEIDTPWVDGEKIKNAIVGTLGTGWRSGSDKAESFEAVIKKINAALGDLSQAGEHEWIGKLNSIIGLISGDQLVFSQTGRISGYLFRGNKISHITEKPLEGEEAHPLKTFVSIIDGSVAAFDKVIIANTQFYSHLSLDRLRQIFAAFSYKDAIAEISKNLRRSKIRDVNLMVFDLADEEDDEPADDRPDIILLDDIPDSPVLHYTKMFFKGLGRGAKATGRGAKKFAEFWSKSIQPKISAGARNVGGKIKDSSGKTFQPVTEKFGSVPRVNYFNKKTTKGSGALSGAAYFYANLILWSKALIKPENRKYLYIGILVLLLAVGFIKIQINSKKHQSLNTASDNLASLDSARSLYSKALEDLGLKKSEAKDELISARDAAAKAASTPAISDEAKNLLTQIQAKLDSLNTATRIAGSQSPTFSFSSNPIGVFAVGANLFSITSDGVISQYDTRTKTMENFGQINSSLGKVVDAVYNDNDSSLLILTDKPAVAKLNTSTKVISEPALAEGASWEKSVAITTYSTNIYLLDSETGQIWKHSASDTSYSKGSAYVPKQPVSLKDSADLAIDGNVFVLKSDGAVIKISKSIEDTNFAISGIPTPDPKITTPFKILTDQSSNSIYIVDKSTNRVLQFSKTGSYQKQYVLDDMSITGFAVNEKLKKLWLISDSKVFELDT